MLEISNDPLKFILIAFYELYPDQNAFIQFQPQLRGAEFGECGSTLFPDDGSIPIIEISTKIPYEAVPEILTHELAHLVIPEDEHGEKWEGVFEKIHSKYEEIIRKEFDYDKDEFELL